MSRMVACKPEDSYCHLAPMLCCIGLGVSMDRETRVSLALAARTGIISITGFYSLAMLLTSGSYAYLWTSPPRPATVLLKMWWFAREGSYKCPESATSCSVGAMAAAHGARGPLCAEAR